MAIGNSVNAANTNHNLIVGSGAIYNAIAPSSTSGYALLSNGSSANPSFQQINGALNASITTASDATYALAVTSGNNAISGMFCIGWTGTNRNQMITFYCDSTQFDSGSSISIISNSAYTGQIVLSNIRTVSQNSDSAHYLLVDVANRNSGTGPLTIAWYGNINYAPILAPASPGANTALPAGGILIGTSGQVTMPLVPGTTVSNQTVATMNSSTGQLGNVTSVPVANGGTGLASTTANGVILGGTTTTGNFQNAGAGTATQYLISNGSSSTPSWQSPTGGIVQQIRSNSTSAFSTTAQIPTDGTIPQNTEGTSLITATITPKSASNILIFDFSAYVSGSNANICNMSLIEGSTANAVYATAFSIVGGGGTSYPFSWRFYKTAPGTSSVTYTVRFGNSNNSTTIYVNSIGGTQIFGAVETISFTVTEVFP